MPMPAGKEEAAAEAAGEVVAHALGAEAVAVAVAVAVVLVPVAVAAGEPPAAAGGWAEEAVVAT